MFAGEPASPGGVGELDGEAGEVCKTLLHTPLSVDEPQARSRFTDQKVNRDSP
jgi:hypothetical protein